MRKQEQKRQGRTDSYTQGQVYDESDPEKTWKQGIEEKTQSLGRDLAQYVLVSVQAIN